MTVTHVTLAAATAAAATELEAAVPVVAVLDLLLVVSVVIRDLVVGW